MAFAFSISRRSLAIGGIVVGIGLAGYALFGGSSDEEKIRALLDRLAQAVSVTGQENPVLRAGRLRSEFADVFTRDVRVKIPELTSLSSGRDSLVTLAAQTGSYFRTAEIILKDVDIQLVQSGVRAQVSCQATLLADRGQGLRRDERRVRFDLGKKDDDWRIDSVTVSSKGESLE
jgi:hypothetical protein